MCSFIIGGEKDNLKKLGFLKNQENQEVFIRGLQKTPEIIKEKGRENKTVEKKLKYWDRVNPQQVASMQGDLTVHKQCYCTEDGASRCQQNHRSRKL